MKRSRKQRRAAKAKQRQKSPMSPRKGRVTLRGHWSARTIVVRIADRTGESGVLDEFPGEERQVEHRDPSRIKLYGTLGFYFAQVRVFTPEVAGQILPSLQEETWTDRSPTYWCSDTELGTEAELLDQFPEEADLIYSALALSPDSSRTHLARVIFLDPSDADGDFADGDDDDDTAQSRVIYVCCSEHDRVLSEYHGIEGYASDDAGTQNN